MQRAKSGNLENLELWNYRAQESKQTKQTWMVEAMSLAASSYLERAYWASPSAAFLDASCRCEWEEGWGSESK